MRLTETEVLAIYNTSHAQHLLCVAEYSELALFANAVAAEVVRRMQGETEQLAGQFRKAEEGAVRLARAIDLASMAAGITSCSVVFSIQAMEALVKAMGDKLGKSDELLRATFAEAEAWATEAGLTLDDLQDTHGTFARIRQYVKELDQ